jgi:hypothetical protein
VLARPAKGVLFTGLVTLAVALPATLASAQGQRGLFDFLFGGFRNPSSASSYADPNAPTSQPDSGPRFEAGAAVVYCVRTCDGRYFPIQRSSGANAAQVCGSYCPAARTKIYSGSEIKQSVAQDGTRYADMPNAFAYRDRLVAGCTCNGKDAVGLVTPATTEDDPTLRAGDIVATDKGFVAYNGGNGGSSRHAGNDFTPVETYGGLPGDMRQRLAATRIVPRNATPVPEQPVASTGDRRVQLGR